MKKQDNMDVPQYHWKKDSMYHPWSNSQENEQPVIWAREMASFLLPACLQHPNWMGAGVGYMIVFTSSPFLFLSTVTGCSDLRTTRQPSTATGWILSTCSLHSRITVCRCTYEKREAAGQTSGAAVTWNTRGKIRHQAATSPTQRVVMWA